MSTRKLAFACALACGFAAGAALAEAPGAGTPGTGTPGTGTPGLGKPIAESDIAAWNIDVLPDGAGLPPGSGTARQGAVVYSQKCALCHGENGVNPAPGTLPLVGPSKFDRIDTMKTVPYYKYATTVDLPHPAPGQDSEH
jgi:S-disulfanyl-L-cysteine oxidoreductase SoxD